MSSHTLPLSESTWGYYLVPGQTFQYTWVYLIDLNIRIGWLWRQFQWVVTSSKLNSFIGFAGHSMAKVDRSANWNYLPFDEKEGLSFIKPYQFLYILRLFVTSQVNQFAWPWDWWLPIYIIHLSIWVPGGTWEYFCNTEIDSALGSIVEPDPPFDPRTILVCIIIGSSLAIIFSICALRWCCKSLIKT